MAKKIKVVSKDYGDQELNVMGISLKVFQRLMFNWRIQRRALIWLIDKLGYGEMIKPEERVK